MLANEANAKLRQFLQRSDKISQRSAPVVEPPDNHHINFSPAAPL